MTMEMTALSIFEFRRLAEGPACDRCDRPAWANTPEGLRCDEHAIAEVREAVAANRCDWVPRLLARKRAKGIVGR